MLWFFRFFKILFRVLQLLTLAANGVFVLLPVLRKWMPRLCRWATETGSFK